MGTFLSERVESRILFTFILVEQQKERKKELAKRLMEMNARKREERLAEDEEKYNQLQSLVELYDEGEEEEYLQGLAAFELKSFEDLQKNIQILAGRIDRTRQKIAAANNCEEIIVEDKPSKIPKLELPLPTEDMTEWLNSVKRKVKKQSTFINTLKAGDYR